MKIFSAIGSMLAVSGCMTTSDLGMLVDSNTALELMKGAGSISRSQNGDTVYRYVVSEKAYNGAVSTPAEMDKQVDWLVSAYLGEQNACPLGYTVDSLVRENGFIITTGHCK